MISTCMMPYWGGLKCQLVVHIKAFDRGLTLDLTQIFLDSDPHTLVCNASLGDHESQPLRGKKKSVCGSETENYDKGDNLSQQVMKGEK